MRDPPDNPHRPGTLDENGEPTLQTDFGKYIKRPVEDFVIQKHRSRPLPDDVRSSVQNLSQRLGEDLHRALNDDITDFDPQDYKKAKKDFLENHRHVKWWASKSERTVACIGKTFGGRPIYDNLSGVIVKFNPILQPVAITTDQDRPTVATVQQSGNLSELAVWSHANVTDTTEIFGTIFDYSDTGSWIAMKQYIPLTPGRGPKHSQDAADHLNTTQWQTDHLDRLRTQAEKLGYNPHLKDCNAGFDPQSRRAVIIDIGSHCTLRHADEGDLSKAVLATGDDRYTSPSLHTINDS
jgi:hypothetical protein